MSGRDARTRCSDGDPWLPRAAHDIVVFHTGAASDGMSGTVDGLEQADKTLPLVDDRHEHSVKTGIPPLEWPEFFAASGAQVKHGLILLYQPPLTGDPVVGDAEFEDEARWFSLQERRVRLLQVINQSRLDVIGLSNEEPLQSIR